MSPPRRKSDVLVQDMMDGRETLIVDPKTGQVVTLNQTGAAVWYLCDGKRDAAEIAQEIVSALPGPPPPTVEADVRQILETLTERGFLA